MQQRTKLPGSNTTFPGFYREKSHPGNVGYVTDVSKGCVTFRGTKGHLNSALMGSLEFMQRFEKVPSEAKGES